MESNPQQQWQQPEMAHGLTRFRSAPSSFFFNMLDSLLDDDDVFLNGQSSPETGRILSQLISSGLNDPASHQIPAAQSGPRELKDEAEAIQQSDFSSGPHHQRTDFEAVKMVRGNTSSNLIRQGSSPAGLFPNIIFDGGGYGATRGAKVSSLISQLTPIAEIGNKRSIENIHGVKPFGQRDDFMADFPVGSWDDSDSYSPLDDKQFLGSSPSEASKVGIRNDSSRLLAHHLSLPKTFDEMSAVEKLLQDAVPCKIRAKRGCATHPRSIAERVRRTKISERMRKLQDLVPNMDKQTNTADMLDLAVEYIKDLQQQVEVLSTQRAACTCSNKHQL
ncbi:hypothetical protein SAY87_017961 [Trapa incisa]|uniref:BHLH domain-containing protein n=1 Tax=Trapa incisa TaxID=236973 RepID=A0AAN7L4P0_9MYRT|nr:hypothetical protein SAY87_017961 [Trapa incisa]